MSKRTVLKLLATVVMLFLLGCTAVSTEEPAPAQTPPPAEEPAPTAPPVEEEGADEVENERGEEAAEEAAEEAVEEEVVEGEPMGDGDADVLFVTATMTDENIWTFNVTVEHPDTGWEDYADGWDVVLPNGTVILPKPDDPFTRLLLHPHENEQPFTRSQSNIEIPADVAQVTVRAHDIVDGFGGQEVVVDLTAESGPNFEVKK